MVNLNANITTTTAVAGAVIVGLVFTMWWQRKRNRERKVRIPEKWRRIGTLSEITLYPIKSGKAQVLDRADCTEFGLRTTSDSAMKLRDRLFMVIDPEGKMRLARQHQNLLLIRAIHADGSSVTFRAPNVKDLTVALPTADEAKEVTTKMWEDERVPAFDCGDEAAAWIQAYVGKEGLRVVYSDPDVFGRRDHTKPPFAAFMRFYRNFRHDDTGGGFTDIAGYMLINAASVSDLKERLGEAAPANLNGRWFRPNLLVTGAQPYAEDQWDLLRVGDHVVFQVYKPCTRCIVTTMNPDTAQRSSNMEPLKTLRKYRNITDPKQVKVEGDSAPRMGVYMGLRRPGAIKAGDAVYVPDE